MTRLVLSKYDSDWNSLIELLRKENILSREYSPWDGSLYLHMDSKYNPIKTLSFTTHSIVMITGWIDWKLNSEDESEVEEIDFRFRNGKWEKL